MKHRHPDVPCAERRTAWERVAITSYVVAATDPLTLTLAPGGGQAIRFRAL